MLSALRHTVRICADTIFPPRCGCCGALVESQGRLCTECWHGLEFIRPPCCAACGYPFFHSYMEEGALCTACMQHKPAYDGHRAMFRYEDTARKLIHDLKFHDKPLLLPLFAEWLAQAAALWIAEENLVIIPVPLHYLRLWRRRYNQAALLATALGRHTGHIVWYHALKRVRHQPPQASLNRSQRLKNIRGVFAVAPRSIPALQGKTILLVDDVMTTGATLHACARALKKAGAARVYAVTLARTVL